MKEEGRRGEIKNQGNVYARLFADISATQNKLGC